MLEAKAIDVVGHIDGVPDQNGLLQPVDDVYSFTANPGDLLNFEVMSLSLSRIAHPIDGTLEVFDAAGNPLPYGNGIAFNDDSFQSFDPVIYDLMIPANAQPGATYYVKVGISHEADVNNGVPLPNFQPGDYELFGLQLQGG